MSDLPTDIPRATAPVVLLGAGFSKAISSHMPVLAELTPLVLDRLQLKEAVISPFGNDLEQWLSYLSIDQPWLDASQNLANRAMFLRASTAVRDVIQESEAATTQSPYPKWLERLAISWCASGTTVVTFNYDVLLERIVTELQLTQSWKDLYRVPLSDRAANLASGMTFGIGAPPGRTLSLIKLHGSINWGHSGLGGSSADSIQLIGSDRGRWFVDDSRQNTLPRSLGLYDDLEPMIVPPTGTKSSYYSSAGLRAQWRRAATAMQQASSVTVIGYSFPATDLAARHFFAGNVPEDAPITVVDRFPNAAAAVQGLTRDSDIGAPRSFHGPDAVDDYVAESCGDVVRWSAYADGNQLVPWAEVNGNRQVGAPKENWDDAYINAGSLALQKLGSLDLNASEFRMDNEIAHWPGLKLAYEMKPSQL